MKKYLQFAAGEFFVCILQSAIFFLVIVFISNFFRDKIAFENLIESKLNSLSLDEFLLTCLAVIVITGFLTLIDRIFKNFDEHMSPVIDSAINKALLEMPKTLYLLASSVGTLGITFGLATCNTRIAFLYLLIWLSFFTYGSLLSFLLTPKPHSKEKTHEQYPS